MNNKSKKKYIDKPYIVKNHATISYVFKKIYEMPLSKLYSRANPSIPRNLCASMELPDGASDVLTFGETVMEIFVNEPPFEGSVTAISELFYLFSEFQFGFNVDGDKKAKIHNSVRPHEDYESVFVLSQFLSIDIKAYFEFLDNMNELHCLNGFYEVKHGHFRKRYNELVNMDNTCRNETIGQVLREIVGNIFYELPDNKNPESYLDMRSCRLFEYVIIEPFTLYGHYNHLDINRIDDKLTKALTEKENDKYE